MTALVVKPTIGSDYELPSISRQMKPALWLGKALASVVLPCPH